MSKNNVGVLLSIILSASSLVLTLSGNVDANQHVTEFKEVRVGREKGAHIELTADSERDCAAISIVDKNGHQRVFLGLHITNHVSIQLCDPTGTERVFLLSSPDGSAELTIRDGKGASQIRLSAPEPEKLEGERRTGNPGQFRLPTPKW